MPALLSSTQTETLGHVRHCCQALHDKKAENISVLFLGSKSSIADFFIIATGTSDPHLRALSGAVEQAMSELPVDVLGRDRSPGNGWMVVDAYDFIVHLFTDEMRQHYNLEGLWKDAELIQLELS